MKRKPETPWTLPAAPYLIAPQEEAVVDSSAVSFKWEAVEGVTEYLLEVASDTTFETIVFTQILVDATSLVVKDVFPPDEATYYWRVFSRNEAGESHGDVIESFISGTSEDAERHFIRPDHKERLGPLAKLMTGGSKDVMYLHSLDPRPPDVEIGEEAKDVETFYEIEDEVGVEHEGIEARQVVGIVAAIFIGLAILIAGAVSWIKVAVHERQVEAAAEATYPELREVELRAARQLNHYEVIDAEQGIYRIPIDHAMDLIVNEAHQEHNRVYPSEL